MHKWSKEYSVGIDEIDQQHKELFRILCDLDAPGVNAHEQLSKLFDYTDHHFNYEIKLMRELNPAAAESHHESHSDLIAELSDLAYENMKSRPAEVARVLKSFIYSWIVTHILHSDKPAFGPKGK